MTPGYLFVAETSSYGLEQAGGRYWRVIHKPTGGIRFASRYKIKAERDMRERQKRLDALKGSTPVLT